MAGNTPGPASHYTPEVEARVKWYIDEGWKSEGHFAPSRVGLCKLLKIHRCTSYRWQEVNPDFNELMQYLETAHEHELWEKGLRKEASEGLCKLALANFGHGDRQRIDHTSNGETVKTFSEMYGQRKPEPESS